MAKVIQKYKTTKYLNKKMKKERKKESPKKKNEHEYYL